MATPRVRYEFNPAQALRDFQNGPDIPRPNIIAQQIPVVGSAWQAVGDLQDGDYGNAILNGASAVAEAFPVGAMVKGAKVLKLGTELLDVAPTANRITAAMRAKGLAGKGEEIHHAIRLMGAPRNTRDIRNNPVFLKVLPTDIHRRIHGRWQGQPRLNPAERVWHGTTAIMKTAPVGLLGYTVSSVENQSRASPGKASSSPQPAPNSARGQR